MTGKKTPMATTAIFDASPKPNARRSSGISATFGIGNSAAINGSKKMRTIRDIAMKRPIATAGTTPITKPATTRHNVAIRFTASSPLTVSCQNRTAMSLGVGMKRRSPKPSITKTCQTRSNPIGEIR